MPVENDNIMGEGREVSIPVTLETDFDTLTGELQAVVQTTADLIRDAEAYTNVVSQTSQRVSAMTVLLKEGSELQKQSVKAAEALAGLATVRTERLKEERTLTEELVRLSKELGVEERSRLEIATRSIREQGSFSERFITPLLDISPEEQYEKLSSGVLRQLPRSGAGGRLSQVISSGSRFAGPALGAAGLYLGGRAVMGQLQNAQEYSRMTGGTSVSEAMGYDVQARLMALDPMLSSRQARQAIEGTLGAGYVGDEAQEVISFVADNLKTGVMDVSQSLRIYRSNVLEAGGSLDHLSSQLDSFRNTASETTASVKELQENFTGISQSTAAMGLGESTTIASGLLAQQFADIPSLTDISLAPVMGNVVFQSQLASRLGTNMLELTGELHRRSEGDPAFGIEFANLTNDLLRSAIMQYAGVQPGMTEDDLYSGRTPFMLQLAFRQYGLNLTEPEAVSLANALLNEDTIQSTIDRETERTEIQRRSGFGDWIGAGADTLGARARRLNPTSAAGRTRANLQTLYGVQVSQQGYSLPLVEQLFERTGNLRNIGVELGDGQRVKIEDFLNFTGREGMIALQQGLDEDGNPVRVFETVSGAGKTISDEEIVGPVETLAERLNPAAAAGQQQQQGVLIGLTPEAARVLTTKSMTGIDLANSINEGISNYGLSERGNQYR